MEAALHVDPWKSATMSCTQCARVLTQERVLVWDTSDGNYLNKHIVMSFFCIQYIPGILWVMMVNPSQAPVCKQGRDI